MKTINIFERNPKKTIIILMLSALLIIDIFSANLRNLYVKHVQEEKQQEVQRIDRLYRIASDIYHHDLAENVYLENTLWGKQYTVATDSLGFKSDIPKDIPLISKKYRIVFIGDSFTEGIGIRYQNTFVGIIANNLFKRNIEVLNASVSSYSPIIYYRKIKYLLDSGLKFDELVVFIDISDVMDEAINYEMSPTNTVITRQKVINNVNNKQENVSPNIKKIIRENSILIYKILNFIHDSMFNINTEDISGVAIWRDASMWTINEHLLKIYGNKGLKSSEFYMDQLHQLLELNDIKLTIAVYPWPDQILGYDLNSLQVKYWRKWAQQKRIDFLNYFPCFINKSSISINSRLGVIKKYFIDRDVNLNEEGHKLIASEYISFFSGQDRKCVKQGVELEEEFTTLQPRQ
jgi:lysophospholipase L1-like esterase